MATTDYNTHSEMFPLALRQERWEELTIADHVVFGSVMLRPDLCKHLIELCLDIPIDHIEYIQRERDIHAFGDVPGVRLDVYVGDGTGRVFNVELQRRTEEYLPQRTRYYQASISHEMAAELRRKARNEGRRLTWDERYCSLKDSYVIFICLTDPFGRGWKRYVFENRCVEDTSLRLGDGTTNVYLNARWNRDSIADRPEDESAELDALLAYFAGGYDGDDEFVQALDEEVRAVVAQPEWRKRVMFEYEQWEDLAAQLERAAREKGRRLGIEQGMEEGRREGRREGRKEGCKEGREQAMQHVAKLTAALQEAGRGDELLPALQDDETFDRLYAELCS